MAKNNINDINVLQSAAILVMNNPNPLADTCRLLCFIGLSNVGYNLNNRVSKSFTIPLYRTPALAQRCEQGLTSFLYPVKRWTATRGQMNVYLCGQK